VNKGKFSMQELFRDYLEPVSNVLNYTIFTLGDARITPLSIVYLLVLLALLFFLSGKLKFFLVERLLGRTKLDLGARQAIGTISRYFILFIGFLIILQTVGINLTTLNVLAGAVGIGVGFGLQNIASNFISGLIILFERPVQVGDRIEIEKVNGKVISIGARSTIVRTNDNITIIVPNSKFISENVINWSFEGKKVRFRIPIGVAYSADINLAKRLLLRVADENGDVLKDPKPTVRLIQFGASSIDLELWVWSKEKLQRKTVLISDLNFSIWEKFRAANVEIPNQQMDLHLRSGQLEVKGGELAFSDGEENSENETSKENEN
jgi:small-conductance mechanosensitive channel